MGSVDPRAPERERMGGSGSLEGTRGEAMHARPSSQDGRPLPLSLTSIKDLLYSTSRQQAAAIIADAACPDSPTTTWCSMRGERAGGSFPAAEKRAGGGGGGAIPDRPCGEDKCFDGGSGGAEDTSTTAIIKKRKAEGSVGRGDLK